MKATNGGLMRPTTKEAPNASRDNNYIQNAILNGTSLNSFKFPASELLKGGLLILEMGPTPNKNWAGSVLKTEIE